MRWWKQILCLYIFFLPSYLLAAESNFYIQLKSKLLTIAPRPLLLLNTTHDIPSIDAPLYCQESFGPCYLYARTMLYNTFSPDFTTPEQVQAANGGSYYMPWQAVGSPDLHWVYPHFRNRWDTEVQGIVDTFLRAGKPVIIHGKTKKGYQHASLLVGKHKGKYLVNDSGWCQKNILLLSIYEEKDIWGVFMYDRN